LKLDNVLLAPHAGTKTMEDRIKMSIEMAQNIVGFYEGKFPVSELIDCGIFLYSDFDM
jgi:phosphoglycerate dehydrogenase-like enzyme